MVSVLFCDLVGFTTLSESKDPEEVRELLSAYFDVARTVVQRYGGTVEKFIGDAVMAAWGVPTANEDDAERAVRAALDLVGAVQKLGADLRLPSLAARAGVLSGEAAVNLNAVGEGMVAGDLVNTASRIQSVAEPGTVLVGETTRRVTDAAVAYADAGLHQLKGKSELAQLWQALRVVAGRGGALKSVGLEAPFVGRDRELRLVRELFHACAEQRNAHLLAVTGIAGIGKSRLAWELFKYTDGLTETVWWHRGRCLAYGEGVTYWALAEMVRFRARIAEDEQSASATAKLRAVVAEMVEDEEERRWVEPRLASLLGLGEQATADATDLFSGWRVFFERMADRHPVVLVFEDLQWADSALLDFVEYLMDWSRHHPLFVVTLARPEIADRRAGWNAGRRNVTSLSLEPLSSDAMDQLLQGLVPGLPDGIRGRIRDRSEGTPLYAVETVRMLLDRGALVREGDRYVPVSDLQELDVPESLHALIAARLDNLEPAERALLQDASVLGKTFSQAALAAVVRTAESELAPLLASLVRKELLAVQADPRSPDLGEYGFLQALVQKVAHDTLSRRDRKARHLAVAEFLRHQRGVDEVEVVEVVASHYLEAYLADPDASDAPAIRALAREYLARAGERAGSVAAHEDAASYFAKAADMSDDPASRAELVLAAGQEQHTAGHGRTAERSFEEARGLFDSVGDNQGAARATAELAQILCWERNQLDEALHQLRTAYDVLVDGEPNQALARVGAQLARLLFFRGLADEAYEVLERALVVAEMQHNLPVLSDALNTKSLLLDRRGRPEESFALIRHALTLGLDGGVTETALRAYVNLSYFMGAYDRLGEGITVAQEGLALARKGGHRHFELFLLGHLTDYFYLAGRWEEAMAAASELPDLRQVSETFAFEASLGASTVIRIAVGRGRLDEAEPLFALFESGTDSADLQRRGFSLSVLALGQAARGNHRAVIDLGLRVLDESQSVGGGVWTTKHIYEPLFDSSLALRDRAAAARVLSRLEEWRLTRFSPYMRAQAARFRARLGALGTDGQTDGQVDLQMDARMVERQFRSAEQLLADAGFEFARAKVQTEFAEWLSGNGRLAEAEPLRAAAFETFERLGAVPWIERLVASQESLPTDNSNTA